MIIAYIRLMSIMNMGERETISYTDKDNDCGEQGRKRSISRKKGMRVEGRKEGKERKSET